MKKIIVLMLICCMVLPMIPTLAAEQGSDDYDFDANEIMVTIHPDWYDHQYEVDDFSEINCIGIYYGYDGKVDGRPVQKLLLTLAEESHQNVLECIEILLTRPDVYAASANHLIPAPGDQALLIPVILMVFSGMGIALLTLRKKYR